MTRSVERYTLDKLQVDDAAIKVMTPRLGDVPVHWHDFYELVLVVDGAARHVVNGVPGVLEPGSAFLLSPVDFHEITPQGTVPLTCYNVVVAPQVLERQLDELVPPDSDWTPWVAHGVHDAAADFRRLQREACEHGPGHGLVMEALVRCVVVELARRCCPTAGSTAPVARAGGADVRRAVMFLERRFRDPITLADAAAVAHLSPNYFSERFRAATGISFQTYLQDRRLRFARSLLASTGLGVTEVCYAAGFNSPSHFGRAYRRRYGESPSGRRRHSLVSTWQQPPEFCGNP